MVFFLLLLVSIYFVLWNWKVYICLYFVENRKNGDLNENRCGDSNGDGYGGCCVFVWCLGVFCYEWYVNVG